MYAGIHRRGAKGKEGETGEDRPGKGFEERISFSSLLFGRRTGGVGRGGIKKIRNLIRSSTPLQRGAFRSVLDAFKLSASPSPYSRFSRFISFTTFQAATV